MSKMDTITLVFTAITMTNCFAILFMELDLRRMTKKQEKKNVL